MYLFMYVFVCVFVCVLGSLIVQFCWVWYLFLLVLWGVFFFGNSSKILKLLYIIIIIFIVKLRVFGIWMQMNDNLLELAIGKVRKTQHQNPKFGHTQGDVNQGYGLLLLKIGLQLCFESWCSPLNKKNRGLLWFGWADSNCTWKRVFSSSFCNPFLTQDY